MECQDAERNLRQLGQLVEERQEQRLVSCQRCQRCQTFGAGEMLRFQQLRATATGAAIVLVSAAFVLVLVEIEA